jgi:hypothetical protein
MTVGQISTLVARRAEWRSVFRRFALRASGGLRTRGGNTGVIFTHSYNKANQRAGVRAERYHTEVDIVGVHRILNRTAREKRRRITSS